MQQNPPKSLATLKIQLEQIMREIKPWGECQEFWDESNDCCVFLEQASEYMVKNVEFLFFPSAFNREHQKFMSHLFLLGKHSGLFYFFPGRSIDVTPMCTPPTPPVVSHFKPAGFCYDDYLKIMKRVNKFHAVNTNHSEASEEGCSSD